MVMERKLLETFCLILLMRCTLSPGLLENGQQGLCVKRRISHSCSRNAWCRRWVKGLVFACRDFPVGIDRQLLHAFGPAVGVRIDDELKVTQ